MSQEVRAGVAERSPAVAEAMCKQLHDLMGLKASAGSATANVKAEGDFDGAVAFLRAGFGWRYVRNILHRALAENERIGARESEARDVATWRVDTLKANGRRAQA